MNSPSTSPLKALVWIVVPEDKVGVVPAIRTWLNKATVGSWIDALRKGAQAPLEVRIIALCVAGASLDEAARQRIKSAIKLEIGLTRVEFENTSCLRSYGPGDQNAATCDFQNPDRCAQGHRLLLVDEKGDGYPCYGYWHAYRNRVNGFPAPDKQVLMESYENGRFRSLCTECAYAHRDKTLHLFPCSRLGANAKPWVWDSRSSYCHVQFAGEGKWCESYEPLFEPSLERSRSLLEKILTSGDPPFWRTALIEQERELSEFWPVKKDRDGKELNVLPIFGEYDFGLDTPTALYSFPATTALPDGFDQLANIKPIFLPACFIPPLRALFLAHYSVDLVSVILTDRYRDSEFNYRALYRETSPCFAADQVAARPNNWIDVWRLPNETVDAVSCAEDDTSETDNTRNEDRWGKDQPESRTLAWRDLTLNLSSSVLDRKTKQPIEYVAIFKPEDRLVDIPLGNKLLIDFSQLIAHINDRFLSPSDMCHCFFASRSSVLKEAPHVRSNYIALPGKSQAVDSVFMTIWEYCFGDAENECTPKSRQAFANLHYRSAIHQEFVPCDMARTTEDKLLIGSLIANYIIWVFAVFGKEHISAVESFNATAFSNKEPSQFVVFSNAPLDSTARARFKLTLATLLQPIESTYAIFAEAQTERKIALHAAFRNSGHTLLARIGSVQKFFGPPNEPSWHRTLREDLTCLREEGATYHDLNDIMRAYHLAWTEAESLFELCLVLQLWGFSRPDDFWYGWGDYPEKKGRFLDYSGDHLDLVLMLPRWCSEVFSFRELKDEVDGSASFKGHDVYLRFVKRNVSRIVIQPEIKDPERGAYCRLGDGVLKAIFLEILKNSVKYGVAMQSDRNAPRATVEILADIDNVLGERRLILWNYSGKDMEDTQGWRTIHPNAGKGLGLVAGVLQNLALGDIVEGRFRTSDEHQIYAVAIHLTGMTVESNDEGVSKHGPI